MEYGMIDGYGFMGGMGFFGPFMMIFWLAVIIGIIVLLVRWLSGSSSRNDQSDAVDVLEKRFARGEIDATEFEDRKRQLKA